MLRTNVRTTVGENEWCAVVEQVYKRLCREKDVCRMDSVQWVVTSCGVKILERDIQSLSFAICHLNIASNSIWVS
jgi:hypothetical protein